MPRPPWIIAHRGASHLAPENTLPAFRLAWQEGADGIEADFRLTGDGRIVCIHDPTTGRTAGVDRPVAGSSSRELARLDVGRWKGPSWHGVPIPTLAQVLAELPPERMLFAELKGGAEIVEPLVPLLEESGKDPALVRILAFEPATVADAVCRLPGYRICWLVDYPWNRATGGWSPPRSEILATLRRSGCAGVALSAKRRLDRRFTDQLRQEGFEIHVWTVDDPARAVEFSRIGVDSIITNRPGRIREAIGGSRPG